jgi:F0F1-type ATP synthase membrane subunit c/vacuolar-type H+-ATPase subunit K
VIVSQYEVRQVEDRTTNLPSRRALLRMGLALGAGLLVNGSPSAVAAGVGVDILCHQVSDGG